MGQHDAQDGTRAAVLFADICESSRLYAERGDRVAFEIASQCLDLLAEATRASGGRPVKRLGDGLLSTFEQARDAVEAAEAMLVAVASPPWGTDPRVRVHVGVSHGSVVVDRDDVHGDVVNVASRLASLARADEIFLSGDAYAELPLEMQRSVRSIEEIGLRNRPGEVRVYQYLPDEVHGDETIRGATLWPKTASRLELAHGSEIVVVGPELPTVRIGRDPENDLCVAGTLVSRRHAQVASQHGGFVLRDFSTNGTYVLPDDGGASSRVFRAERALGREGRLGLGTSDEATVRFRIVD